MRKILIETIVTKQTAIIALKFRPKDKAKRLEIIQLAAKYVPLMAEHTMNKDKKNGLI